MVGCELCPNQLLKRLFKLAGRAGKHFPRLRLESRKDTDHGRSAVDFGKDRRAGIPEIRKTSHHQDPDIFGLIGAAVSQYSWRIAAFFAIADFRDGSSKRSGFQFFLRE